MRGLLHHIELYVKDLKKSKEFWGWFLKELGYVEYQSWDKGVSYLIDKTYIVFVQVEDKYLDMNYHRCGHGLNHLCFHGETDSFIDEMTVKLKEKNVKILYEDKHPYAGGDGYYAVYFEDPDRMKVEITSSKI